MLFETSAQQEILLSVRTLDGRGNYDLTVEGTVLLAEGSDSDAARVAALIRRVLSQCERIDAAEETDQQVSSYSPPLQPTSSVAPFDWPAQCRAKDLSIHDNYVDVKLPSGRQQRIGVEYAGYAYRLSTFVAKQAFVASHPELQIQTWLRNGLARLVGFRADSKGRLVAESWVPNIELNQEDFRFYVRILAQSAGQFEYAMTGRDAD
jgi:hypothetical protein